MAGSTTPAATDAPQASAVPQPDASGEGFAEQLTVVATLPADELSPDEGLEMTEGDAAAVASEGSGAQRGDVAGEGPLSSSGSEPSPDEGLEMTEEDAAAVARSSGAQRDDAVGGEGPLTSFGSSAIVAPSDELLGGGRVPSYQTGASLEETALPSTVAASTDAGGDVGLCDRLSRSFSDLGGGGRTRPPEIINVSSATMSSSDAIPALSGERTSSETLAPRRSELKVEPLEMEAGVGTGAGTAAAVARSGKTTEGRYAKMDENDEENEEFDYNDAVIQRDAANDRVAFMVHVALFFFAFLFSCAIMGSFIAVSEFGFINFVNIVMLVTLVVGSGLFLTKIIVDDQKLKPVRRQMNRWRAIAKAVVVNEMQDFQTEMNEHLLLTNESAEDGNAHKKKGHNISWGSTDVDIPSSFEGVSHSSSIAEEASGKKSKSKSVLFRMVRPFLKPKGSRRKRSFFRRSKKKGKGSTNDSTADGYAPPMSDAAMT